MSANIHQIFIANPITSNASTDLMYFGQSPYGLTNDAAMTFANFAAQFGAPFTPAALTRVSDTNVTLTLGGTPATSLLQAVSITAGWSGQLSLARGGTNASLTASAGSIAYSTASALALGPATATAGLALLSGSDTVYTWSASPPITQIKIQTFGAGTSTYTPSTGMVYCTVRIWGPGGGSGGAVAGGGTAGASAGGGGGGYCERTYTAALIGATATVVVGAGGAGGTAGNNAGGDGSANSTFTPAGAGTVLTANLGTGGAGHPGSATISVSGNAGQRGLATGGQIFQSGANGTPGIVLSAAIGGIAGSGGGSGSAPQVNNFISGNGAAIPGQSYGTGASGANNYGSGNVAGAAGADGFCYITEYCSQ